MHYYSGYRLARFIVAATVCLVTLPMTITFLGGTVRDLFNRAASFSPSQYEFWRLMLQGTFVFIGPFLVTLIWAFFEGLWCFGEHRDDRRDDDRRQR